MNQVGEYIGWLGALCLAICSLPQVIYTIRYKSADGISWGFILLWFGGEIFTLAYLFMTGLATYQLIFNYGLNLIGLGIILYYKIKERYDEKQRHKDYIMSLNQDAAFHNLMEMLFCFGSISHKTFSRYLDRR